MRSLVPKLHHVDHATFCFMSTMKRIATGAVALGTLSVGCHSDKPEAKEARASVSEPETPQTTSAAAEPTAPAHGVRLADLRERAEWAAFKAFWQTLDAVPKAAPFEMVKHEDATAWREELTKVVPDIEKLAMEGLLHQSHARLLTRLLSERVGFLSGECDRLMVMHMAPMPYQTAGCSASRLLETRIDVLMKLRGEGKMSDATFETALQGVIGQLELAAVTQLLGPELDQVSVGLEKTASQLMDSIRRG